MTPLSRAYKKRKGMQLTINPTFEQKLKPQNGYTYYMYYSCAQKSTFPFSFCSQAVAFPLSFYTPLVLYSSHA